MDDQKTLTPAEIEQQEYVEMWKKARWGKEPTPEELYELELSEQTREAEKSFKNFKHQMQENPQLAILALTMLEPHLENFREHMKLLEHAGYEKNLIPFNWSVGTADHEVTGVTPRVLLRRAMYNITAALTTQTMDMGQGRKANTDKLKDIYLATASARWIDEVLNSRARKGGDKAGLQLPKVTAVRHGGSRPGAGRPPKHSTPKLRPVTDLTEDENEENENELQ